MVYGEGAAAVQALADASLNVESGERIALVGRSGSGKSTLLHVLGGLVEPTRGDVVWRGRPLDRAARGVGHAQGIAYVFQGANLLPHFTALENLAFAAHVSRGAGGPSQSSEQLLELVGLGAKAEYLPAELSGGEAQRIALARAIAQQPELLLCDEPTGHLDSDTAVRVLDMLDALQAEFRFALVLATHDEGVARRFDRRVALDDGRVTAQ